MQKQVISCRACPRLVRWRERVGKEKVRRFSEEEYWAKPIPSFGDPKGRLLLVGLAPAAHGGNRTGRMFTGDNSGNWLYRALYKAGFANQPTSLHRDDGLKLGDCYITAALRCAPPLNKPTPKEISNCRPFLLKEIALLKNVRVVVGLGKIGFEAALNAFRDAGKIEFKKKPKFAHCAVHEFEGLTFIASFHPSQQNTFTGRLTEKMLDDVFVSARRILRLIKAEGL
ncbi:MAG: uracil-DNA glycosylase [Bacteroidetes bacterium]|nr:uracil-DNA glycosylase [Bacteroidota bacterium]MCW5894891.1 uracil-DNA glycosylase [Bacteroidota bacterium]